MDKKKAIELANKHAKTLAKMKKERWVQIQKAQKTAQKRQLPFVAHTSPHAKAAIVFNIILTGVALTGVAILVADSFRAKANAKGQTAKEALVETKATVADVVNDKISDVKVKSARSKVEADKVVSAASDKADEVKAKAADKTEDVKDAADKAKN